MIIMKNQENKNHTILLYMVLSLIVKKKNMNKC